MGKEHRIYCSIEAVSIEEAEAAAVRNKPDELLLVAIGVGLYSDDLAWAEQFCVRLAAHQHFNVRGNAILALGHLSRRFRTLKQASSLEAIRGGLSDSNDYIRGQSEAAADDVEWFAKLSVRPLTEIEGILFAKNVAHVVAAFDLTADTMTLVVHPRDAPDEKIRARFLFVVVKSTDDSYSDGKVHLPWEIIGIDSTSLPNHRWRFCLHTEAIEYNFEAEWPTVDSI